MSKRRKLQIAFYVPGVLMALRVILTLWVLIINPLGMPMRFFQLIPLGAILVSAFTYFKLYRDSVPVISLILPSIIHFIMIYAFKRVLVIWPFGILLPVDIIFLVVKSLKSSMYPFDMDTNEENLEDVFDFLQDAE